MHILYVIHAFPWNETTGATLVLDNYLKQAHLRSIKTSILVPEIEFKNLERNEYGSKVGMYSFKYQENWGVSGFDLSKLNDNSVSLPLKFKPDLVHVIDWVNFHPSLFFLFKKIGCPIVRSVCNFEEFCPFSYPVFYFDNANPCSVPLDSGQCLDCVSDNAQLNVTSAVYTYKYLIRDLDNYKKSYRKGIGHLLSGRRDFVRALYKDFVDYVVFPSENFAHYFLTQLMRSVNYRVIPHGLENVSEIPVRESRFPIKIIYTGGDRVNKGWDVLSAAIDRLSTEPNDKFEIHFVGNTDSIPDQFFQNSNIKLVRCPPYRREEEVSVLRTFDIAIVPSHFESYGLFVRECVRSRVVPIVLPSLGVSDFIANGKIGFELDVPYVENLVHTIQSISKDPESLTAFRRELNITCVPSAKEEFDKLYELYCQLTDSLGFFAFH